MRTCKRMLSMVVVLSLLAAILCSGQLFTFAAAETERVWKKPCSEADELVNVTPSNDRSFIEINKAAAEDEETACYIAYKVTLEEGDVLSRAILWQAVEFAPAPGECSAELHLDAPDGELLGTYTKQLNSDWMVSLPVAFTLTDAAKTIPAGEHTLYITFKAGNMGLYDTQLVFNRPSPRTAYGTYSFLQDVDSWYGIKRDRGLDAISVNEVLKEEKQYVAFEDLDFGSKGVGKLTIRHANNNVGHVFPDTAVEIRLGSPTGTLVGTAAFDVTGGWDNWTGVEVTLTQPVTGVQDLYVVFDAEMATLVYDMTLTESKEAWQTAYKTFMPQDVDEGSTSAGETLSGEGNWFSFKSVEFGENGLKSIRMNLAGNGNNDLPPIKVYIDDRTKEENLIGTIQQQETGGWDNFIAFTAEASQTVTGRHDVFVVIGGGNTSIRSITFVEDVPRLAYDTEWFAQDNDAWRDVMADTGYTEPRPLKPWIDPVWHPDSGEHWFLLRDLEFGSNGLKGMELSYSYVGEEKPAAFEVRVDQPDGELLGTFPIVGQSDWPVKGISAVNAEKKLTGRHDIYVLFKKNGSGGYDGVVHSITFREASAAASFGEFAPKDADIRNELEEWADGGSEPLSGTIALEGSNDSFFALYNLDFGTKKLKEIRFNQLFRGDAAALGDVTVEVRDGAKDGPIVASYRAESSEGWSAVTVPAEALTGRHDLFFVFKDTSRPGGNPVVLRSVELVANERRPAYERPFYSQEVELSNFRNGWDPNDAAHEAWESTSTNNEDKPYFLLRNVDFGTKKLGDIIIQQASNNDYHIDIGVGEYYPQTTLEIRLDSLEGPLIATFNNKRTGDWHNWEDLRAFMVDGVNVTGVHDVYFLAVDARHAGAYKSVRFVDADHTEPTGSRLDQMQITVDSEFDGYNSIVDRPYTQGEPAYNYSVHMIKRDDGSYEAYIGGRWRSDKGDGDHILKYVSANGAAGSWQLVGDAPIFWQGGEDGKPGQWFSGNIMDPEVMRAPDGKWLMYVQVQIDPTTPLEDGSLPEEGGGDRILLLTSDDGVTWTRKEDRGVIVNMVEDGNDVSRKRTFHHQEVIYVPWDTQAPYWMYVCINTENGMQGYFRIRSDRYDAFDYTKRETVSGMKQLGNQIGYLKEGLEEPLFIRPTFEIDNARATPRLQFSEDGLRWSELNWILAGSDDEANNKGTYFLGFSTINGRGEIPYNAATGQWEFLYGASTCNTSVAPEIFNSLIGGGRAVLSIDEHPEVTHKNFLLNKISTDYRDNIVSTNIPIPMRVSAINAEGVAYHWSVSDESIATIDEQGVLRAKKAGTVRVTLVAEGQVRMCSVAFKESEGVIESEGDFLLPGSEMQLAIAFRLKGYPDYDLVYSQAADVEWSIISGQGASISADGLLSASAKGDVTVQGKVRHTPSIVLTKTIHVTPTYIKVSPVAMDAIQDIQFGMRPVFMAEVISLYDDYAVEWSCVQGGVEFTDMTTEDMPANITNMRLSFTTGGEKTIRVSLKNGKEYYGEYTLWVTADKIELQIALETAADIAKDGYSTWRWGRLQEAVSYGRQLMEEPYALQEDVEKAAALIYQRIDELELPDEPDVSGGDGSGGDNVETGVPAAWPAATVATMAFVAAAATWRKRRTAVDR